MESPSVWFSWGAEFEQMQNAPVCTPESEVQKGYTVTSCICEGKTYSPVPSNTADPVSHQPSSYLLISGAIRVVESAIGV